MKIITLYIALLMPFISYGQTWQKTLGGTENYSPNCITKTSDNGFLISGTKLIPGGEAGFILKIDSIGNSSFTESYSLSINSTRINYAIELSSGDIIATGYSDNNIKFFMKLNSSGAIQYVKEGGAGTYYDPDAALLETSINDFILGDPLSKINISTGDTIWTKSFLSYCSLGGMLDANISKLFFLSDGNILGLGGACEGRLLIKLNSDGDTLWSRYTESCIYCSWTASELNGGSILVSNGSTLIKLDNNGTLIWEKGLFLNGGTTSFIIKKIISAVDGGAFLAGTISGPGIGSNDIALMKIDGSGNVQWTKAYGSTLSEDFSDAVMTLDNHIMLMGKTNSFSLPYEIYLIKTDSLGNSGCNEVSISANSFSSANTSFKKGLNISFPLLSYNTSAVTPNTLTLTLNTLCSPSSDNEPDENSKSVLFPNPSNNFINIIDKTSGEVTIYNCLGQVMIKEKNKNSIDISTLYKGIYFVKIPGNGNKMLKLVKE